MDHQVAVGQDCRDDFEFDSAVVVSDPQQPMVSGRCGDVLWRGGGHDVSDMGAADAMPPAGLGPSHLHQINYRTEKS